jgi:hypothetical protein
MERKELVEMVSRRANVSMEQAELAINQTIVELVSPQLFKVPGGEVAFLDNNCNNNCKEQLALAEIERRR